MSLPALPTAPPSLSPSPPSLPHPPSAKGQMSSMVGREEICKSAEVYSVTCLPPAPLKTPPPTSLPHDCAPQSFCPFSMAAKKGARRERERGEEPRVCFSLEHILKSLFFSALLFSLLKAFFCVENSPLNWWQSRGLCWLFFPFPEMFLTTQSIWLLKFRLASTKTCSHSPQRYQNSAF